MRDKNVAGILALLMGFFGIHRFYLGDVGLGILSAVFCWTFIPFILGLVDAIIFFSMDDEVFNYRYNGKNLSSRNRSYHYRRKETDFDRYERRRERQRERYDDRSRRREEIVENPRRPAVNPDYRQQRREQVPVQKTQPKPKVSNEPYKSSGIRKYKDYDYDGAIEDFKQALEINPKDIAVHFNIACAYSLNEKADMSFYHLDKAVALGFNDFKKIQEHDALAYLRIQDEFDKFKSNGYRISKPKREETEKTPEIPNENSSDTMDELEEENLASGDLLQQLQKLGELREKGLLTDEEFATQKRKLLG